MSPHSDALESPNASPLGSRENPIRCAFPAGQREYLARLRDGGGLEVRSVRIGSFGAGPYGNVLDGYCITSEAGESMEVFFDMYHLDYFEEEPIPGFTMIGQASTG